MARVVYRVLLEGGDWKLSRQGSLLESFVLKSTAIAAARECARNEWRQNRQPIQLLVHASDGSIEADLGSAIA